MGRRRGMTIIELLMVMTIIGLLVRIAIPKYGELRRQAQARQVLGDVHAVRHGVMNFNAERNSWPSSSGRGALPPSFASYLPGNFSFQRGDYDWSYVTLSMTVRSGGGTTVASVPTLIFWTSNTRLANSTRAAAKGFPHLALGNIVLFYLNGYPS